MGVGGSGPAHQATASNRDRGAYAGPGPTPSPSGGAGVSARLCTLVPHRRVQGVCEGSTDALWALGPTTSPLGDRPQAQAPLDAAPPVTVCSGAQADLPATAGGRELARGVRHPGGDPASVGRARLA